MPHETHQSAADRIAEYLREELDDELRGVSYFSPETETIEYIRGDVQEKYTADEIREIHHDCDNSPPDGCTGSNCHLN